MPDDSDSRGRITALVAVTVVGALSRWWPERFLSYLHLVTTSLCLLYVCTATGQKQPNCGANEDVSAEPEQNCNARTAAPPTLCRSRSTGASKVSTDSWWGSCCTARALSDEKPSPEPTMSPAEAVTLTKLSPKFCGLRISDPSVRSMEQYCLQEFKLQPVPPEPEWEPLLRCSEAERAAVRALRQRLKTEGVEGPMDCVTLLRFIRGRRGDVKAAAKMYVDVRSWEKRVPLWRGFQDRTIDDTLHRCLDKHWPPSGLLGHDLDGDPIYWIRQGHVNYTHLGDLPENFWVAHEVYSHSRILQAFEEDSIRQKRPVVEMTVVVDLGEASMLTLRQLTNGTLGRKYRAVVRISEDNFPGITKRVFVVRAPWWFAGLWQTISRFYDESSRLKFQIVSAQQTYATLTRAMDAKWVPEALGGSNRLGDSEWCAPAIADGGGPTEALVKHIVATYT